MVLRLRREVAEDKPHKRKWKAPDFSSRPKIGFSQVLTKENGLLVTSDADPNSKAPRQLQLA